MRTNFETTTNWLLVHEGGYVNDPDDPGGPTNKGVTQRVYNAYRARKNMAMQSVKNISMAEVLDIYRTQYWNAIKGDYLPSGLYYTIYDYSVNSGASRAIKDLQKILGVKADGVIGNLTLAAISASDIDDLIVKINNRRLAFMKSLKGWKKFGKGWQTRVMGKKLGVQADSDIGVIDRSMKLANGSVTDADAPQFAIYGKAEESDVKKSVVAKEAVLNEGNILKVGAGAVPGLLVGMQSIPDGPMQWAVAGLATVAGLLVLWVFFKKYVERPS